MVASRRPYAVWNAISAAASIAAGPSP